jgi:NAD(P)-dependent dehydrogenase (short-subunit alcohol dehydrogenase family)
MERTYVVTGAASGIGAAVAKYLRKRGARVIACDLQDADVIGDLATSEGRVALVDGVRRLAGGGIDGIIANAGATRPEQKPQSIKGCHSSEEVQRNARFRRGHPIECGRLGLLRHAGGGVHSIATRQ